MTHLLLSALLISSLATQPPTTQPEFGQTPAPPMQPPTVAEVAAARESLSETQIRDLRCASGFAIIASEQERGAQGSDQYPPLAVRGQAYFADVAQATVVEAGLDQMLVGALLVEIVEDLQAEAVNSTNPAGVVDALLTTCLPLLDAAYPMPPEPSLAQCAAILRRAHGELLESEGASADVRDLDIVASVLEGRTREAMLTDGLSGNEADMAMFAAGEEINAALDARPDTDPGLIYDLDHCFELAAP